MSKKIGDVMEWYFFNNNKHQKGYNTDIKSIYFKSNMGCFKISYHFQDSHSGSVLFDKPITYKKCLLNKIVNNKVELINIVQFFVYFPSIMNMA